MKQRDSMIKSIFDFLNDNRILLQNVSALEGTLGWKITESPTSSKIHFKRNPTGREEELIWNPKVSIPNEAITVKVDGKIHSLESPEGSNILENFKNNVVYIGAT